MNHYRTFIFLLSLVLVKVAYPEAPAKEAAPAAKPVRTFLTIQRYSMDNNGEAPGTISNVKIELTFPNGKVVELPGNDQFWPISNGQAQEINVTYEIPAQWVEKDGFKFKGLMVRKGVTFKPCEFDIANISEFNRAYVCGADVAWQEQHHVSPDKINRQALQIRVFSDKNSLPKEIPTNALALK